jgi:hypothetical protein
MIRVMLHDAVNKRYNPTPATQCNSTPKIKTKKTNNKTQRDKGNAPVHGPSTKGKAQRTISFSNSLRNAHAHLWDVQRAHVHAHALRTAQRPHPRSRLTRPRNRNRRGGRHRNTGSKLIPTRSAPSSVPFKHRKQKACPLAVRWEVLVLVFVMVRWSVLVVVS